MRFTKISGNLIYLKKDSKVEGILTKYMLQKFFSLIKTDTGKDTSIVFLGTAVNLTAGAIFFIITPRILGPEDYGLFATIITTGTFAATLANFGLDTGILKFAYRENAQYVLALIFKLYIALGIIAAVIGILMSGPIAYFLNIRQGEGLLQIAFASTILLLLTNYFVAALQAKKEFTKASIVSFSSNIARIFIIILALFVVHINLLFVVCLYFLINIVSIALGFVFSAPNLNAEKTIEPKKIALFSMWIAPTIILASIPLDNFFLIKLAGAKEAGIYAAPFKLLTVAYGLGTALSRVFSTRFANFSNNLQVIEYAKKAVVFPAFLVVGFIVLILIAPIVINLFFGSNYLESINVLRIQAIGFIFFLAAIVPASIILYYFGKPKVTFFISVLATLIYTVFLYLFVPPLKSVGASMAFALNELITFGLLTVVSIYYIKTNKK